MALILNIETATTNCSVSIAKEGKILAIKEHDTPNYSHSEPVSYTHLTLPTTPYV